MSRYTFHPPAIQTAAAQIFADSGCTTPAVIVPDGDSGRAVPGAVLAADIETGTLPAFRGPDAVATLYMKQLDYRGQPTGSPTTLTGIPAPGSVAAGASGLQVLIHAGTGLPYVDPAAAT